VTLYLPRSESAPQVVAPELAIAAPGGLALLVEDNADVAEVGREMLTQLGYRVRLAPAGRQGLEMVERATFDLVVSDIVMPGEMNGVELARSIRTARPGLPVLLVTGYAGSSVGAEFPVLRKPYRLEQLRQAIAEVVRDARPQREVAQARRNHQE